MVQEWWIAKLDFYFEIQAQEKQLRVRMRQLLFLINLSRKSFLQIPIVGSWNTFGAEICIVKVIFLDGDC